MQLDLNAPWTTYELSVSALCGLGDLAAVQAGAICGTAGGNGGAAVCHHRAHLLVGPMQLFMEETGLPRAQGCISSPGS